MNKIVITIVLVAVIVLGGYFLLRSLGTPAPSSNLAPQPTLPEASRASPVPTAQAPTQEENEEYIVTYTDAGYSPNTITVKVGETVTWKNNSSKSMWTASAGHPSHRVYPTTGGCLGSTFDACQGVQPGGSWSFKFDIAGAWKYHNHLNPADIGTIIVEK